MSNKKPYIRLDKNDAAMLLVDHQSGLLSLVRDIEPDKFKNNVLEPPICPNTSACPPSSAPVLKTAPTARWCPN